MITFRDEPHRNSWNDHQSQWGHCSRCPIGDSCRNHVLGRGKLPCEVLLIGEAPGPAEDTLGEPFVGRSGKLLNTLLAEVARNFRPFSYFITNTLACFPAEDHHTEGSSFRAPTKEEQANCYDRLVQVLFLATPRKLIYVGKSAAELEKLFKKDKTTWDLLVPDQRLLILHPSYINRRGGVRSVEFKRTMSDLVKFLKGEGCVNA